MSYSFNRSKKNILELIKTYGYNANDYFCVSIGTSGGGLAPRRVNYSDGDGNPTRVGYCEDNGGVTPDGLPTCILNPFANSIALAWIDRAEPTGNDAQYGCPFYSGSRQSDSAFDYLKFENCTPECHSWAVIIGGGVVDETDHNSFPCNLNTLTVHGPEPTYFWYEGNFLEIPVMLGLPVFETQADAATFVNAVIDYINDPSPTHEGALDRAGDKMINSPGAKPKDEYGDKWSEPDGYSENGAPGSYDNHSDVIDISPEPSYGVSTSGLIHVYKVDEDDLANLADDILPNPSTAADVTDALKDLFNLIFRGNLLDFVVDVHIIPCAAITGSSTNIKVGTLNTSVTAAKVVKDYVTVTVGSVSIPEYFKNFADFMSTNCKIFCPFYGYIDVQPEFWNGGKLDLVYRFNVIDGSFMIYIKSTSGHSQLKDTVIAQYSGSACIHTPISGKNYSAMLAGYLGNAAAAVTNLAGGNAGGAISSAVGAINATRNSVSAAMSNSYNASSSILSNRQPYLLIEYPAYNFSKGYPQERGLPLNVYSRLGSMRGFTVVEDVNLNGIGCSDQEGREIQALLREGVIV